jgi:hypothetical protein
VTFLRRLLADRSLLLVLLLATLIVFPRSALIATAHSESVDDEYHLVRGVRFLVGGLKNTPLNDPTLGETIIALPLWLLGAKPYGDPGNPIKFGLVLHGQSVSPEVFLMCVAMLKSALFVPFVAFCFAWIRRLYNERAGWAAAVLLLIEPTISAHVTPAALDVIGFEAIVIACWCWWRYFARPTWATLSIAAAVSGATMLIKHTAVIMPFVALAYAVLWCVFRRDAGEPIIGWIRARWIHGVAAGLIAFVTLVIFSGGFVKVPKPESAKDGTLAAKIYDTPWPGGRYIRSLQTAMYHGQAGHTSWFMGHRNDHGSLAYYPVVALYKVPIPLLAFIALGGISLIFVRPRFEEWALVVPMLLLAVLITTGGINIGFRHAIPVVGLLLLLSTRVLLIEARWAAWLVTALLAITTVDVARWCPNLISYLNWPRQRVWMDIADSNLDWGQGLKQIRTWIDAHKNDKRYRGRTIWVRPFGLTYSPAINYYLGDRVKIVDRNGPVPTHGILIISPSFVVGLFHAPGMYDFLRDRDPVTSIGGGANLVFDLDQINRPADPNVIKPSPATGASSRPATR